jgi:hypothetical protein
VLLDVLEANGFPDIRSKMQEREYELMSGATLREILTVEEIEVVRKVLREFKVPGPTGWANALLVHAIRGDIARFSEDNVYDYTELCNFSYTLREAGLADSRIWSKIETAKNTIKRYSS